MNQEREHAPEETHKRPQIPPRTVEEAMTLYYSGRISFVEYEAYDRMLAKRFIDFVEQPDLRPQSAPAETETTEQNMNNGSGKVNGTDSK